MDKFDKTVAMTKMREYDLIAIKTSKIAESILELTNYELGYLSGLLVESNPIAARGLAVAINLNLEEMKS